MRSFLFSLRFFVSKFIKKARLSSIRKSDVSSLAVVHSGSSIFNSTIERYSYCGYDCSVVNADIGPFCSIAGRVSIGGVGHPLHFVSTSPAFLSHRDSVKTKFAKFHYLPAVRTTIGGDVWIGEGALIKAGIVIGAGAVVGMGAVVTKNVPPYAIVAGNPAKIIRMRFSEDIVSALMALKWWELPDAELFELGGSFNDPQALLRKKDLL